MLSIGIWLMLGKLVASAFVVVLLAAVYAGYDALTIFKRNQLGITASLNHKSRHFLRLTYAAALGFCTFGPTWLGLAHALVLASIFFLVFDPVLNRNRGKATFYMSGSNFWDATWLRAYGEKAGLVAFRLEAVALVVLLANFFLIAFYTL